MWSINQCNIELKKGDITQQTDIEAIVNAANAQLLSGGGVAGAIHNAAGPKLSEACRQFAPIKVGEAVITPAFKLPNSYVIHCLGPRYGIDKPEAKLLANCYKNAIKLAYEKNIQSIAFPAISTGIFAYPFSKAAEVAIDALAEVLQNYPVAKVRIILFSQAELEEFKRVMLEK